MKRQQRRNSRRRPPTTAALAQDASSVPTIAQLHKPWGRRKGNHDRESLLRVDLRTTTTASFSDNEEQVRGGNPKTACGEAAEKNGIREKKRSKTKRRIGGKKRNCCQSWWGPVKTCELNFRCKWVGENIANGNGSRSAWDERLINWADWRLGLPRRAGWPGCPGAK